MPVRCHLLSPLFRVPKANRSVVYDEPQAAPTRVPGMDGVPSAAGAAWLNINQTNGRHRRQHAHEPSQALDWEAGRRALEEAELFMRRTPAHANIKKDISALGMQRCRKAKGECSVCLMEMEAGEMVRTLKCGHSFHVGCECKTVTNCRNHPSSCSCPLTYCGLPVSCVAHVRSLSAQASTSGSAEISNGARESAPFATATPSLAMQDGIPSPSALLGPMPMS
jgi:hypothetical protein